MIQSSISMVGMKSSISANVQVYAEEFAASAFGLVDKCNSKLQLTFLTFFLISMKECV